MVSPSRETKLAVAVFLAATGTTSGQDFSLTNFQIPTDTCNSIAGAENGSLAGACLLCPNLQDGRFQFSANNEVSFTLPSTPPVTTTCIGFSLSGICGQFPTVTDPDVDTCEATRIFFNQAGCEQFCQPEDGLEQFLLGATSVSPTASPTSPPVATPTSPPTSPLTLEQCDTGSPCGQDAVLVCAEKKPRQKKKKKGKSSKGSEKLTKSTKAPSAKSSKAPSAKSTKAPSAKSTKAPSAKSTKAPSSKSTKAPSAKSPKGSKSTKAPSAKSPKGSKSSKGPEEDGPTLLTRCVKLEKGLWPRETLVSCGQCPADT